MVCVGIGVMTGGALPGLVAAVWASALAWAASRLPAMSVARL